MKRTRRFHLVEQGYGADFIQRVSFMLDNHQEFAGRAAKESLAYTAYLEKLVEGEVAMRQDRTVQRRIAMARFPVIKTIDQFDWSWPKKINRLNVQNLFRLSFMADKTNVILLGGTGLGKSHIATSLGYERSKNKKAHRVYRHCKQCHSDYTQGGIKIFA